MIARTSIALPLFLATLNGIAQHPAAFVENRGQWPKSVTHKADLNGATVWCERGAILIDRFDGPDHSQLSFLRGARSVGYYRGDGENSVGAG